MLRNKSVLHGEFDFEHYVAPYTLNTNFKIMTTFLKCQYFTVEVNQKPKSLLDNHDIQTIVHDFLRKHLSFDALPLTFQGSSDIKSHHQHINRIHVSASGNCAVNWDTPCRIHIFKLVHGGKLKSFSYLILNGAPFPTRILRKEFQ